MCFDRKHQLLTDQNKTLCTPIYFVMAQAKGESIIYLIVLFCYISSRSPTTLRRHCHPLWVVYVRFGLLLLLLAYVWMCSMARQQQKKNIYIIEKKSDSFLCFEHTEIYPPYTQPHNRRDINTVSFFSYFFCFVGPWSMDDFVHHPLLFFFLFFFFLFAHCVLFHYYLLSTKYPSTSHCVPVDTHIFSIQMLAHWMLL